MLIFYLFSLEAVYKLLVQTAQQCCFEFAVPDGGVKPVLPEVHSVDSSSSFYHASSYGALSWNWSCVTEWNIPLHGWPVSANGPFTLRRRNLWTEVSLWKRIKCSLSTPAQMNLKTQQSTVILNLCLRKTRSGKLHGYCDCIVQRISSIFKVFFVYSKTRSRSFQIPLVWWAFPKNSVVVTN